MENSIHSKYAIWGITPGSINIARRIADTLADADVYISSNLSDKDNNLHLKHFFHFEKLRDKVSEVFHLYEGHIFIMATGIVVRMIAPLIRNKATDPGVVVIDDRGKFAISLISGHIGGANELTQKVADIIGALPVITTATDVNKVPSVDLTAKKAGLVIENPNAIKYVNMAFLKGERVSLIDPCHILPDNDRLLYINTENLRPATCDLQPCIYISEEIRNLPENYLILRPKNLVAGIGCNRNTGMDEIEAFLRKVMKEFGLSFSSLKNIASIDIKKDEPGLIRLAENLKIPIDFYSKDDLNNVKNIQTPSSMVKKHIGVNSVCEAAAMLSAKRDSLIVPKQKSGNVTLAIAKIPFLS